MSETVPLNQTEGTPTRFVDLFDLDDPRSPGSRTPISEKEHKKYAKSPYYRKQELNRIVNRVEVE